MKLIDMLVSDFSQRTLRSKEIKLKVDGQVITKTIYAKNLNIEDKSSWLKKANGNSEEYLLYAAVFGVCDEHGELMFSLEDKPKLKKFCDGDTIADIASFVLNSAGPTDEEREKN